ncbi:MAG: DUF2207 domain-containing protein [Ahrensia sp.]|nr:DUF2207 domain-containing protein [Ahrensia sp.]
MLRFFSLLMVFVALALTPVKASERILSFDSDITIEASGAFLVKETIVVNAEGDQIRRGIFRDFPTVFTNGDKIERKVDFDLISVARSGRPEKYVLEPSARFVRIRIGNADVLLRSGKHTYEITYRTNRQLRRFEKNEEIFWNVTGNAWAFPIDKATATVRLPTGASALDSIFYTGRSGSTAKNASKSTSADGQIVTFATTKPLAKYEGLTVGVKFPKGFIAEPTQFDQFIWFLKDNLGAVIAYAGLFFVGFYYLWAWSKVGRDPPKNTVVPRWDMPENVSPALTNYIYNKGLKNNGFTAISAAALSLAVKGIVTLDSAGKSLSIRRIDGARQTRLPVGEASLLARVNGAGGTLKIDKANGKTVQSMAAKFQSDMESEHRGKFYNANLGYIIPGVLISVITAVGALVLGNAPEELVAFLIPLIFFGVVLTFVTSAFVRDASNSGLSAKIRLVVMAVIGVIFVAQIGFGTVLSAIGTVSGVELLGPLLAIIMLNGLMFFLMGAPTKIGQAHTAEIEGLKLYLTVAEEDRMNMLNSPEMSPKHFETLLPYAVALGVEKPWSRAFQGWLATAVAAGAAAAIAYQNRGPGWYGGSDFSPGRIGDTFGDNRQTIPRWIQ